MLCPDRVRHDVAVGVDPHRSEWADLPIECLVRRAEAEADAALVDDLVPPLDAGLRILDIVVAELLVERVERRRLDHHETALAYLIDRIGGVAERVIVPDL